MSVRLRQVQVGALRLVTDLCAAFERRGAEGLRSPTTVVEDVEGLRLEFTIRPPSAAKTGPSDENPKPKKAPTKKPRTKPEE